MGWGARRRGDVKPNPIWANASDVIRAIRIAVLGPCGDPLAQCGCVHAGGAHGPRGEWHALRWYDGARGPAQAPTGRLSTR